MKKMTAKEFKEILDKANIGFETFGYEGILNLISIAKNYQAKEYEQLGQKEMANWAQEDSDTIYNALDARGYYK